MSFSKRIVTGIVVAAFSAVPIYAAVKASAARPGNWTFTGTSLVPLTSGGATSVTVSGGGKFAITYSAECAVEGSPGNWLSLQISVDGTVLAPTADVFDAFCAGNETPVMDGWATHSITVATPTLAIGPHVIRVEATVFDGSAGWLSDSSLVVEK